MRRPARWRHSSVRKSGVRLVKQEATCLVAVALPGRASAHVDDRGQRIRHVADAVPEARAQRMARCLAFDGGGEQQLEHEDMVACRELAVEAALESL
jgi:hypothetical protein